ncbi:hypothetical protein HPP92_013936 [Vanilla planifolia]|uniref:Uncharacterized protein n=1 Tax=Vanilla planifolia TaxID=51239 RepID=A0A835QPC2_VANPL|nr:hypothetical protein HPP92_013936 [Vanilla planifolia]
MHSVLPFRHPLLRLPKAIPPIEQTPPGIEPFVNVSILHSVKAAISVDYDGHQPPILITDQNRMASPSPPFESANPTDADHSDPAEAARTPHCKRRKPVILKGTARTTTRFAEVAGRKTAECAAICCFPCGIFNLVVLATVRLPAGICRRAARKRILVRRAKKREKAIGSSLRNGGGGSKIGAAAADDFLEFEGVRGTVVMVVGDSWPAKSPSEDVIEFEKEMWSEFYGTGFWRSPSRKDEV